MLDNYSPSFEFAKQRNRKLLEDTHELGAILTKLKSYYKEYQDNQVKNNVVIASQPDNLTAKFENRSLQIASKYSESQDDLLHPLPPEMSTDLKSDAVNFSKKENSPEPPLVKKMVPLKIPISPLAANPPVKSPTPPSVKSPLSSSIKSPLSSLARAEQIFSQSSSSDTESETEASTQQQSKPTQNLVNPARISNKSVDTVSEKVEVDNSSKRSSKRVLVIDPPNELVEEVAILDFDHSGRRKSLTSPAKKTPPDLQQHRTEILETLNKTKNAVKSNTPTPDTSLSPRRKSTGGSRVSQLASENSSGQAPIVENRISENSTKKSTDVSRRSTVASSISPRNTELSRKSQETKSQDSEKTKTRNTSINSGIKLLEMKSPRSRQSSARDSARSSVEEALSSKRGFIPSGDEISPRTNDKSPRKTFENSADKINSARSSLGSRNDARPTGTHSEKSTRRQSNAKIVAEILDLSDDNEEKPWYDVQPKSTERKSKLFASSFNALEDDEDSFSYE